MSVSDSLARLVVPIVHLYPEVVVGKALTIFCNEDRVNNLQYVNPILVKLMFGKLYIVKSCRAEHLEKIRSKLEAYVKAPSGNVIEVREVQEEKAAYIVLTCVKSPSVNVIEVSLPQLAKTLAKPLTYAKKPLGNITEVREEQR